jgi:hypothetical protein
MRERQQNSTAHPIPFLMVASSDHVAGVTGLVPTVTVSKDGGAFAVPAGAVTEIANGFYSLAGNAADRNTLGAFLIHATGAGADPCDAQYTIVGYDPFDGQRLGLTGLPATGTLAVRPAVTLAAADVTGSLPSAPAAGSIGSATFAAGATLPRVALADTLTTYTGDTPQTGDAYDRLGVNGAGLTALGDARLANLDAPISGRSAPLAGGTVAAGSTPAAVVVAGLPAGKSYAGQRLYHAPSGEARTIATQAEADGDYTFTFAGPAGSTAGPFSAVAEGDAVTPIP